MTKRLSRRQFVSAAGAASLFTIVPSHVLGARGAVPPGGKLRIASIGVGGMGHGDVRTVAADKGVTMVALCDIDSKRRESTAKEISGDHPNIKHFTDFRKMFDELDKDIDAVTVSTPDHSHAMAAMAAIRRKKHVYCQKPLAHSIWEVRQLMKAAKENNVVTQLGNQGHSTDSIRLFCEWIWDGAIGKVERIDCGCRAVNSGVDKLNLIKTERPPVPPNVDWDLWLGPALDRPYHPAYLPGAWRGWVPFGNGTIGDWVCHVVDPVFWALDLGAPKTVVAEVTDDWSYPTQGDAYPKGDRITFEFAANAKRGPVKLVWHSGQIGIPQAPELEEDAKRDPKLARKNETGAFVYGDKGVIMYGSHGAGGVRLIPEKKMQEYKRPEKTIPRAKEHHQDWLEAIRTGRKSGSDFSYGGPLTEIALVGIIAMKLKGQKLQWDGPSMRFTNSEEANAFINPPRRKGWEL